jgi:hypothetical protein
MDMTTAASRPFIAAMQVTLDPRVLDHAELWATPVAASPALDEFQAKTARRIPLFTLRRRTPSTEPQVTEISAMLRARP